MSDTPQGPGWWLASDGKYYPPEQAPGHSAAPQIPQYGLPGQSGSTTLEMAGDGSMPNWKALIHYFAAIPHLIFNYALALVAGVLSIVGFFSILFTKKVPDFTQEWSMKQIRHANRTVSYVVLLHDQYPPFEAPGGPPDPNDQPIRTNFAVDVGEWERWRCIQGILLLPHMIVLSFVAIGGVFAYIAGWFAVLFTGQLPEGIAKFLLGIGRWGTRVNAYNGYLTKEYPPFSLD